eukprot:4307469-Karenia_brevis.AAC.1
MVTSTRAYEGQRSKRPGEAYGKSSAMPEPDSYDDDDDDDDDDCSGPSFKNGNMTGGPPYFPSE